MKFIATMMLSAAMGFVAAFATFHFYIPNQTSIGQQIALIEAVESKNYKELSYKIGLLSWAGNTHMKIEKELVGLVNTLDARLSKLEDKKFSINYEEQ